MYTALFGVRRTTEHHAGCDRHQSSLLFRMCGELTLVYPGTVTYTGTGVASIFFNTKQTQQCCGAGVTTLKGAASSLVDLQMKVAGEDTAIKSRIPYYTTVLHHTV